MKGILKNEWNINSIYSFLSKGYNEIPIISRKEKIKLITQYIRENVTNENSIDAEMVEHMINTDTNDYFPIYCDMADINYVLTEWSKIHLPNNQFFHIEYVDDGNCGYIRVMLFEVKKE